MKKLILLSTLLLSMVSFSANAATITNSGFETGDLTGWTSNNSSTSVVTSETASDGTVYTPFGNYMALLTGDLADEYVTLSQEIIMNVGDTISGYAAYLSRDYGSFLDDAYVKILKDGVEIATLWTNDTTTVGSYGDSGWQSWSWTATDSGTYTLVYAVRNTIDSSYSSQALFDNQSGFTSDAPVPEPSSMILGFMGVTSVLAARRRKKLASA